MPAAAEPAGQEVTVYPSFLHCCAVSISKLSLPVVPPPEPEEEPLW